MQLLQVCNVGSIVGGTAACAWSVTRARPDWSHRVAVLGRVDDVTQAAFAPVPIASIDRVTPSIVGGAEAVLLHNTPPGRVDALAVPSLLMRHSDVAPAEATATVACSRDLADRIAARTGPADPVLHQDVLHQGVPQPPPSGPRRLDDRLTAGWLCTPTARKWPRDRVAFCRRLAESCPHVDFEFVGCPAAMRAALLDACGGCAVFHPAGWSARRHLSRWDALLYHNPAVPETFGRTVAEAMLAGCVPVVDRRGGFIEQVDDRRTGILCERPSEFAAALHRLSDLFERRRIAAAASESAHRRFGLDAFGRRLDRVFASMLGAEAVRTKDGPAISGAASW